MSHIIGPSPDNVLIHIAYLACNLLSEGIAKPRKEPVLIKTSPRNPIGIVKAHESFILDYVAEAWRK